MYSPLTSTVSQFSKQTPLDRLVTPMVARPPRPFFLTQHLNEEVGSAAGDLVDLGELGGADHEVQGADDTHYAVQVAYGLYYTGQAVDAGEKGRLVPLLDGHVLAQNPGEYG